MLDNGDFPEKVIRFYNRNVITSIPESWLDEFPYSRFITILKEIEAIAKSACFIVGLMDRT